LDAFRPDVVLVWGDDQYENFREQVIPPFCFLAYGAWGLPDDMTFTLRGDAAAAHRLTDDLLSDGFDVVYSYQKREGSHFPHAIIGATAILPVRRVR
jgi:hypothetical protein